MAIVDNAEVVRALAYEIWEREGRPSGREHEHWAEANRLYAERQPVELLQPVVREAAWNRNEAERHEVDTMRKALWTPEPFSGEMFGIDPRADSPRRAYG